MFCTIKQCHRYIIYFNYNITTVAWPSVCMLFPFFSFTTNVVENGKKICKYNESGISFFVLFRCEAQVSSPPQRTLFGFLSCLRTSWRWRTSSGLSWWLCVSCWSCSPSAQTTCCVFSWWCNSGPSSQMMRWDGYWPFICSSHLFSNSWKSFWIIFLCPYRWLQQRVWQLWVCQSCRQRVVVEEWDLWVSPRTSYVCRYSRWAT